MDRVAEVERFADLQVEDEPARVGLRGALLAQSVGRLDAAAKLVVGVVRRRKDLEYTAVLFALEATEARLGGSVQLGTPPRRQTSDSRGNFELWDAFEAVLWPTGQKLSLEIIRASGDYYLISTPEKRYLPKPLGLELVRRLAQELMLHLGVTVQC